ncbi:hypothetical protein [Sphingomonas sp. 3-13AW]|uniref:hypothetical protein n=1 Tax=Sphingomonas sp. 3-13AW TaxID=3050450 RepID=UPI003BB730A4
MTKTARKVAPQALQKALLEPTLGKRLQAARKALGLTGADVVEKIPGLNRSTLSEIENDVSKRTSYLEPLAQLYGIAKETLLRPDLSSLMREDSLGERIRRRRDELNYTRHELAEAIPGLTYHTLYMIETKGRKSELTPAILSFLGLDRREEETNASALLRLMRTDLFLESTTLCRIAGCEEDLLRDAEDGDTAAAVRVILDLTQGLLQGYLASQRDGDGVAANASETSYQVPGTSMPSVVYDVDDSGRISLPAGTDVPQAITMPDGQLLYSASGLPDKGDYALAIVQNGSTRSGIVGTYQPQVRGASLVDPSNISHSLSARTSLHRLVTAQERVPA